MEDRDSAISTQAASIRATSGSDQTASTAEPVMTARMVTYSPLQQKMQGIPIQQQNTPQEQQPSQPLLRPAQPQPPPQQQTSQQSTIPSQQPYFQSQANGHHQQQQQSPASIQQQQQQQLPQHDYRVNSNTTSIPSVSLPPIQHFEPAQNAMQQQAHYTHMNGDAHMMQHAQQQSTYPYPNGAMQNIMPNTPLMYAPRDGYTDRRYTPPPPAPQPQQQQQIHPYPHGHVTHIQLDPRQMSGGRHKKEIKRRTKTGCLTCRKRRIKCDERHPFCRNCEKSKRECLGYDPIFKQQPGPAPIQPAPIQAMSKSDPGAHVDYSQSPYQAQADMYGGLRVPMQQQPTPGNGVYEAQPYPDPPGSHTGPSHAYHPPFDAMQRPEVDQPKS